LPAVVDVRIIMGDSALLLRLVEAVSGIDEVGRFVANHLVATTDARRDA
jgi:proteasome assembly chaperone (PAC2) family protein